MTNFLNSSIPDIRKIKNLGIKDAMRMVVTFLNSLIPDIKSRIKDAMRMKGKVLLQFLTKDRSRI